MKNNNKLVATIACNTEAAAEDTLLTQRNNL